MRHPEDPHDISVIQVRTENCDDNGSILIFQDPQGQFHEVFGLPPSIEKADRDGWRLVLAVKTSIAGRERDLYRAATRDEIGENLFWD